MPNQDGLEPGQSVDFETIQRIERNRKPEEAEKPKRKARPASGKSKE